MEGLLEMKTFLLSMAGAFTAMILFIVLGFFFLFTLIGLVTKLISDLCYVWVDPRVKFD